MILKDMNGVGKKAGLRGFEMVVFISYMYT